MAYTPNEESAKDYWSLRRTPNGGASGGHMPVLLRRSSHGTVPVISSSASLNGSASRSNSPAAGTRSALSFAAAAAAAQQSVGRRPSLHLVPPTNHESDHTPVSSAPNGATASTTGVPPALSSPSANSTTANSTTANSTISSPRVGHRLWFRKKSGGPATSLIIYPHELVDDLKTRILEKYPTSLQQRCDPADLVMTVQQPSGSRLELQPDENMVDVISRFYPNGMQMKDAICVGPSVMWAPQYAQLSASSSQFTPHSAAGGSMGSLGVSSLPPLPTAPLPPSALASTSTPHLVPSNTGSGASGAVSNAGLASGASTGIPTSRTPRNALQRARSYSHTQNNAHQLIPINQTSPSEEVPSAMAPLTGSTDRDAIHSPSSDSHPVSPQNTVHNPLTSTSNALPPISRRTSSVPLNSTSILLLPRHFSGNSNPKSSTETRGGIRTTKLEPLTNDTSKRNANIDEWADDQESDQLTKADSRSHVSASFLQLQQQISPAESKTSIVPQINVLIVEDNPINQKILEKFMKQRNVRFESANNGREALEKWKKGGFHLILMDIQLPVMTGLEATAEIRRLEIINGIGAFPQGYKDRENPPVEVAPHEVISKSTSGFRSPVIIVALTASSDSDDKSEALAAGCNDFLTKPPHFEWLEKKIIEWGCMQALVDYDGWKKWSEVSA